jgi:hypothetical protein
VLGSGRVGPDRADHRGRDEGEVGFEGEHILGCGQLDHGPAGSVVHPLVGQDTVPLDAERGDDPVDVLVLDRAAAEERRGSEGQTALAVTHADQACATLLDDAAGVLRCAAVVQPRACGP